MYELSRVRLHSVGPKGARYQDVTIDLRDVGEPVPRPVQRALFDVDRTTAALRRPSPATVVFLENGGGKTVLMRLIFSVMLPGRRNVLGASSSSRTLEDYVLANDVAQVALEWQHTRTGEKVVTGKASEWRGHIVSADSSKLAELWYVFRSTASLNLDTLPFTEDGRLVTLAGFRDRLERANRAEPHAQAAYETSHRVWTEKLVNLDLDPELFRYQRSMNAGEGEAADAFTFRSDEAFIDFLLRAVTNDEDPNGLADVLLGYAAKLASRKDLVAERDFVDGALQLITPLATEATNATAAQQLSDEARAKARRLADSLRARHSADTADLTHASAELEQTLKVESNADNKVRHLNEIALELKRLVAELRLAEARARESELKERRDGVEREIAAWAAAAVLVELQDVSAEVKAVRRLVQDKQDRARPALEARDAAATALARMLLHSADQADAEQRAADEWATQLEGEARAADQEAQEAVRHQEQARAHAARQRETIDDVQADLRAAVDEGLLTAPTAVDDAAARTRTVATEARATLTDAYARLPQLTQRRKVAEYHVSEREKKETAARNAAVAAAQQRDTAIQQTAQLAAMPRLAELLGAETVELDADAEVLLDRLADAINSADQQRAELLAEQSSDVRVLTALGDRGLLPPNPSVTEALDVLASNGITAYPGWAFLSRLLPEQRADAIDRHPLLADGIVLNNADQVAPARGVLTKARLVPPTIVAVGTTATMLDQGSPTLSSVDFVVPPNPALFDEAAADEERQRLATAVAERAQEIRHLATRLDDDRELAGQVRTWRAAYPAGELLRLSEAADRAAAAAEEATAAAVVAREERDIAATVEEDLQDRIPSLVEAEQQARATAERLEELARRAAGLPTLLAEERAANNIAAAAERRRLAAEERGRARRDQATTERGRAGDHRRVRDSAREEMGSIAGAGSVSAADPLPDEPLSDLRSRYAAAAEAYLRVEVGDDLLARLRSAEEKEAGARVKWEAVAPDTRTRAGTLLYTPDGADAASRAAAAERLQGNRDMLNQQVEAAVRRTGEMENEYRGYVRQERVLDPYGKPRDIAHGEELIRQVEADGANAREALANIQARRQDLKQRVDQVTAAVTEFHAVLESLKGVAPEAADDQASPFVFDIADARSQRDEVVREVAEAQRLLDEANRKVRAAADRLAQFAQDTRFEDVRSPVRKVILAVERDNMPQYVDAWEAALKPRLRTLNDDLVQIDENRSIIISRLHGLVVSALRTLRQAQRLSKLPAALGDWAGQEFLRIHFAESDPAALHERLGDVVDDTAATVRDDKQRQRLDGMSIVLKGVHAAMPKGVTVDMLKPDTVLRNERVRIAQINDVFSGGQHLTAAIILYCTMAALRANERGRASRAHAGVLFLDNPIGRASAGYLLDLQLEVARALGVQLVYTTGLFDINALSVFPLIVRLRNDADLRAGLKYLSIDETIRRTLDDLDRGPEDEQRITATRLFIRPRESTP